MEKIVESKQSILVDDSIKNWDEEYLFQHVDGHYMYISDRAYIRRDANGVAERVFGVVRDISDRKMFDGNRPASTPLKTDHWKNWWF